MTVKPPDSQNPRVGITAIIVLYRKTPAQSQTLLSLERSYSAARGCGVSLDILLYDNTPGGQDPGPLLDHIEYKVALCNMGLAAAYNWAIERSAENGSQWLLTLDQDTNLPEDFLLRMGTLAAESAGTPMVAAIVPQITGNGRILSPYRLVGGAFVSWFPPGFHKISEHPVSAFNSGALLRVSVLQQVGGYSPWFWLDNSDAFLFHQLHRYGKRVFIAGEVQVSHDFSVLDMRNQVSPTRYHNILIAESAFWDLEKNVVAGWERTARLVVRLLKHLRRDDPPELRRVTMEFLKRRLLWSRSSRLRAWRQETMQQFPELTRTPLESDSPFFKADGDAGRSKVSVCLAAYNNALYIEQQLQSILRQLDAEDEIVIVDDASTDETAEIIRALRSPAIRLIQRTENQGAAATFEEAARNATGQILFFSDGDDIWADNKVNLFLEAFRLNPEANIVTSRIAVIDREGNPLEDEMYSRQRPFHSGFWHNLLRNHFQGSAMAIRASLLGTVLPFPRGVIFFHDHWIGTRNALAGGSALCLPQSLLLYRRHPHNLSRRLSRFNQIRTRLQLAWAHLGAVFAKGFR